jgi:hypothetical protein
VLSNEIEWSTRGDSLSDRKRQGSACVENRSTLSLDALEPTLEAYTDGERRAYARARVQEIAPGIFKVFPFLLREISGREIQWNHPALGEPISTLAPVTSREEAHQTLLVWGSITFATCAGINR